jgi:hypothetical protein
VSWNKECVAVKVVDTQQYAENGDSPRPVDPARVPVFGLVTRPKTRKQYCRTCFL